MQASFDNTVQILVKAFLEGTLLKGDCHACAVGNICAGALGVQAKVEPFIYHDGNPNKMRATATWGHTLSPEWIALFATVDGEQKRTLTLDQLKEDEDAWVSEAEFYEGVRQIEATGYTATQLADVEFAFETAAPGFTEEAEFAGLMAVVDVLADIHGIDLTAAEQAKALFVKDGPVAVKPVNIQLVGHCSPVG